MIEVKFSKLGEITPDSNEKPDSNAAAQKDEAIKKSLLAIGGKAKLSEGIALLHDKKFDDARRFFEQVAQNASSPQDVVANALNGVAEPRTKTSVRFNVFVK